VEIVVTARHTDVSDRFRRHLEEKLAKVEQLAPRAQRVDVEVSHESNPRQSHTSERVEITVRDKGPVIRAEACAEDPYAALDLAQEKLLERLRRARDRRKVHHGRHNPTSVREATRDLPPPGLDGAASPDGAQAQGVGDLGDSPVVIREKTHTTTPMSLGDALYEMELVGHDFFLYVDVESRCPSVVYRRKGWSYGVIRLSDSDDSDVSDDEERVAATG
jgi:ribosomal subunit interface protein